MATSSLFHNFVIEGEENIRRFIDAFDRSMDMEEPPIPNTCREITDPEEFKAILVRQRAALEAMKNAGKSVQH